MHMNTHMHTCTLRVGFLAFFLALAEAAAA